MIGVKQITEWSNQTSGPPLNLLILYLIMNVTWAPYEIAIIIILYNTGLTSDLYRIRSQLANISEFKLVKDLAITDKTQLA